MCHGQEKLKEIKWTNIGNESVPLFVLEFVKISSVKWPRSGMA